LSYNEKYDAIIIGAGIGGLVCGCYLAKAGMKVLIVEQHHKPGGYCTSFNRAGFIFDVGPHCFGSYRKGGILNKIFKELALDKKIKIIRPNPSDIVIMPDYSIPFWNNLEKTIMEFQKIFPEEPNIKDFFYLLIDTDPQSFSRLRNLTFKNLVDKYFKNNRLKATLLLPLLPINGFLPSSLSAFVAAKLYSEFLIDGGYYPEGGMQVIPNALVERFRKYGGELQLSCIAKKIRTKNNIVTGVVLNKLGFVKAKYVISDCDARQTFLKLLGKEKIEEHFYRKLKSMVPSLSNFIIYLGINQNFKTSLNPGTFLYVFDNYDVEQIYRKAKKGDIKGYGGYMFRLSYDKKTIYAGIPAPYKNQIFWENNKYMFLESFIFKLEKYIFPNLSKYLIYKEAATPHTLNRYTLNYKGASFGWAGIPSQFAVYDFRKPSFFENLYLTGHWTSLGVGISGTAYIGQDTAKMVLYKKN